VPFLPAVSSAIHDAIGVWLTQQPFTPERVLAALSASDRVDANAAAVNA
jgi:CO/xanthine dehydrogenase Mo-binding subunit